MTIFGRCARANFGHLLPCRRATLNFRRPPSATTFNFLRTTLSYTPSVDLGAVIVGVDHCYIKDRSGVPVHIMRLQSLLQWRKVLIPNSTYRPGVDHYYIKVRSEVPVTYPLRVYNEALELLAIRQSSFSQQRHRQR